LRELSFGGFNAFGAPANLGQACEVGPQLAAGYNNSKYLPSVVAYDFRDVGDTRINTLHLSVELLLNLIQVCLRSFNLSVVFCVDLQHGREPDRNRIRESDCRLFPSFFIPNGLTFYKMILKVLHPCRQISFGQINSDVSHFVPLFINLSDLSPRYCQRSLTPPSSRFSKGREFYRILLWFTT